jgi:hypothetical protein
MARVDTEGEPGTNDGARAPRVRRAPNSAETLPSRYQTVVLAGDAPTAVHQVGGWLYDHAAQGWHTSAVLIDGSGMLAIRILGAIPNDLGAVLDSYDGTEANAIAVDSVLYGNDIRVRRFIDHASTGRFNEIVVWGDGEIMHGRAIGFAPAEHRLSDAARAFKSYARAALGLDVDRGADPIERFRLSASRWPIASSSKPRLKV